MNVQQQRRFEKRNIPVTFSNVSKPQDKFTKYNIKSQEETDEAPLTPSVDGRSRRDPMARSKVQFMK